MNLSTDGYRDTPRARIKKLKGTGYLMHQNRYDNSLITMSEEYSFYLRNYFVPSYFLGVFPPTFLHIFFWRMLLVFVGNVSTLRFNLKMT